MAGKKNVIMTRSKLPWKVNASVQLLVVTF